MFPNTTVRPMYSLGLDIGSSSIKAALFDASSMQVVGTASSPAVELPIHSPHRGWAEQDPELWWQHVLHACQELRQQCPEQWRAVSKIGIAYQMHGLVTLGQDMKPLRPSIIWCDSRAVKMGERLVERFGKADFLRRNLNTPGNFTLSKMLWMAEHEPELWDQVRFVMLPGDYIAFKLTGEVSTTESGLSEMIAWDFLSNKPDLDLLRLVGIPKDLLPTVLPNFGDHGKIRFETSCSWLRSKYATSLPCG